MSQTADPLTAARDAVSRHAWREAFEGYASLAETSIAAEDLERYGEAAWWSGKLNDAIRLRERAYVAYAGEGRNVDAARVALTLSWDESNRGAFSVAQGWFATAERQLENEEESVEHARVAMTRAATALFAEGNYPLAIVNLDRAIELAQRFGDRDTQMLALVAKGRALMKSGEIAQGLELIDEGTAAAVSGELRPFSTTLVYCMTITSCQDVGDYRRAAEWTEAANRWCDRLDVTGFPGACRIHRAELMRMRGDWRRRRRWRIAACDELHDFERTSPRAGTTRSARSVVGRETSRPPRRRTRGRTSSGAILSRALRCSALRRGRRDAAVAGITRALAETEEPLARMRRLPAQVEIAVAANDLKTAREAAAELESLVDSYKIGGRRAPAFDARVHLANGRIALAEGDRRGRSRLRAARDEWQRGRRSVREVRRRGCCSASRSEPGGDEHAATIELEAALRHSSGSERSSRRRANAGAARPESTRAAPSSSRTSSARPKLLGDARRRAMEEAAGAAQRARRDQIVTSGGEVVQQTGDGFFASFDDPKAASTRPWRSSGRSTPRSSPRTSGSVRTQAMPFQNDGAANAYGGGAVHLRRSGRRLRRSRRDPRQPRKRSKAPAPASGSEPRSEVFKGFADPVEVITVNWK